MNSPRTPITRFLTPVFAFFVVLALATACGGDDDSPASGDAAAPISHADPTNVHIAVDADEDPGVEADAAADALIAAVDRGLTNDAGEAPSDSELDELRAGLIARLMPDGVDVNDPAAFADALAGRLGPQYAGVADIDVLIDALLAQIDPDGEISSVEDLFAALDEWAVGDIVVIGAGATSQDGTISIATSFDQAVQMFESGRPAIDLIAGLSPIELRNVEVAIDRTGSRISLSGQVPAPIAGVASLSISWTDDTPALAFDIRTGEITIADLVNQPLGTTGTIGFTDTTVTIATRGVTLAAVIDPQAIPGATALGIPAGSFPIAAELPGLGTFGAGSPPLAFDIDIPFVDINPVADWNIARDGLLTVHVSDQPTVRYGETWTIDAGGEHLVFTGTAEVRSGGDAEMTMALAGSWKQPFGVEWLTLEGVTVHTSGTGATRFARLAGDFTVAGKSGSLELVMSNAGGPRSAQVSGTLADLTLDDLAAVAREVAGADLVPSGLDLSDDLFRLSDVTVAFSTGGETSNFTLAGSTEILGRQGDALFGIVDAKGGGSTSLLAVTPRNLVLGDLLPVLASDPDIGGIAIPEAAIVLTGKPVDLPSAQLPATIKTFFGDSQGGGTFRFRLGGGLNLTGSIPGGVAPAIDDVKDLLGMDRDTPLQLGGSLPVGVLTGGPATDFELTAVLPEMQPAGSPAWFVSAQLGIRITGQPSIGVVGQMTLDIGGDVQTFEVEASVGGGSRGGSFEIIGRLANPWETPFDVEWLTLDEVVLKLGLESTGSVTLGFVADIQVGSKDIRGAMAVSVSPAGVPTNFVFEAASEAGVSMADLADLYALMSGEPRPPVERALPAAEVRGLALRFAPEADPDLGVEQGFRIAGELWMAEQVGAPLELLVGVDIEVADIGIAVDGYLTDFTLGPLAFDEATLSIAVSAGEQRFAMSGGVEVMNQAIWAEVMFTPTEFSFGTRVDVAGGSATLRVSASFDMLTPRFTVAAQMDEQFLVNVDQALQASLGRQITDLNQTIKDGRRDLSRLRSAVSTARSAVKTAQDAVNITGCGWPFRYLCDTLRSAQRTLAGYESQLRTGETRLAEAEALLDRYGIQLTLVGAEFEAEWTGFEAGRVTMVLNVDASGHRRDVAINWDFNQSVERNVDKLMDALI